MHNTLLILTYSTLFIRQFFLQMESYQQEEQKQQQSNQQTTSQQGKVRIIPIRLEGSDDVIQPQSPQQNKYEQ